MSLHRDMASRGDGMGKDLNFHNPGIQRLSRKVRA